MSPCLRTSTIPSNFLNLDRINLESGIWNQKSMDTVEETAKRKALDLQRFVSGFETGNNPQAGFGASEQCSNVFHNGAVCRVLNRRRRYLDL